MRQYREDRDPRAPLFEFKRRALVHFAADPDEVHMTTRLAGEKTVFLPFNRGSPPGQITCGAGNPQHESGYRTGYFWEEVLRFDSFLDILGHFMFLEQRTEVMVEHFRQKVMGHLGGRAKAVVVTSSRLHAVRYMQAFQRYLAENKYTDIRPLVAFSGTVRDPDTGAEYTEPGMNPDCVTGKATSRVRVVFKCFVGKVAHGGQCLMVHSDSLGQSLSRDAFEMRVLRLEYRGQLGLLSAACAPLLLRPSGKKRGVALLEQPPVQDVSDILGSRVELQVGIDWMGRKPEGRRGGLGGPMRRLGLLIPLLGVGRSNVHGVPRARPIDACWRHRLGCQVVTLRRGKRMQVARYCFGGSPRNPAGTVGCGQSSLVGPASVGSGQIHHAQQP